jgi:hypothetical protein
MADLTQIPGTLNIKTTAVDDLSFLLDFDVVLTGYTFSSKVVANSLTSITVTDTDLSAGKITLSLTDVQLTAIGTGSFLWYLDWTTGTTTRRVLAGTFTIQNYP